MIVFHKKQVVTLTLMALLVVAGYMNFIYLDAPEQTQTVSLNEEEEIRYGEATYVSATTQTDYFQETKLNKEKARSEAIALLREVSENPDAGAEDKKNAAQKMMQIAENIEKENAIESTLQGKGFQKISVYISEENITVSVGTTGLNPTEVAKIRDAVIAETKRPAEQIKIMEIE